MPRPVSQSILVVLAVGCHAVGGLLFLMERASLDLPGEWSAQFFALLSVSLVLTLLAALWRGSTRAKTVTVLAGLCYLLLCYPLPSGSGLRIVLGMPLVAAVVMVFPRPDYLVAGGLLIAASIVVQGPTVVWGRRTEGAGAAELVVLGLTLAFVLAFASALKELAESRRRALLEVDRLDSAIDRIADVNTSFQEALAIAEEEYVLKERNRITREIHDIVGYALTNQQMMIEASLMLVGSGEERLRELLSMAREGVAEGLRETRKTLYELRKMDEPRSPDFGVIVKVAKNFERVTGVRVSVDFTNARGDLDNAAWMSLYRLIQESMINSFRHGKAKNITITFREDPESLFILVRDDGSGAPLLKEGIGLKGMRERVAALGGDFRADNAADGFVVSARMPKKLRREVL
ncbi:MAG TPA: histidine kinase [Rectinemataceae bacterium]|nr:histidine kinase [Rectinemataceae bacterium]